MSFAKDSDKQAIAGMQFGTLESKGFNFVPWSNSPANIPVPSQLIMLGEAPNLGYVGAGWSAYLSSAKHQEAEGAAVMFRSKGVDIEPKFINIRYHNSGWNYLFTDGHIENLQPEDTLGKNSTARPSDPKGGLWSLNPDD